jgi:hypothetical protein
MLIEPAQGSEDDLASGHKWLVQLLRHRHQAYDYAYSIIEPASMISGRRSEATS